MATGGPQRAKQWSKAWQSVVQGVARGANNTDDPPGPPPVVSFLPGDEPIVMKMVPDILPPKGWDAVWC